MTWYCADCDRRRAIDKHGRCENCGSSATMLQDPEEPMRASEAWIRLIKALDTRLPDTELLGEGTVDQLVKRRMSVLNTTAHAMVEEACGAEIVRHKPRMPAGEGIPSYDQITHCECGLRYASKMPEAHKLHTDKVLCSAILTVRDGVINARQINWHDVKEEADSWHQQEKETSEPTLN